jgi:uncharacterized protein with PQ loop repeat
MDCQYIASEICSMSVSNDNNNYLPCTYGGCFVNCNYALYANKEPQYSTCSSETDCSNSHGMPQFARICACESSDSVALSVWQIIGISTGVFFFFSILCALIMYFYLEYSLKQYFTPHVLPSYLSDILLSFTENTVVLMIANMGEKEKKIQRKMMGMMRRLGQIDMMAARRHVIRVGSLSLRWSQQHVLPVGCFGELLFIVSLSLLRLLFSVDSRGNSDQEKGSSSPEQNSRRKRGDPEKKEKKSWLKLKYGKKDKKKAAAPEQGSWYKEGGLPSTYDQPATKEKKTKYSYGDDDIESDLTSDEERRQRRFGEKDRVLSTYAEYQESSSDFGKGKRGERKGPTTTNPTHATPTPVSAPPPLLSQRRASLPPSSSPIEATPTYQPKPVQAPPLLSQRSSKDSQSSLMQSDRDLSDSKSQRSSRVSTSPLSSLVL